MVDSMVSCAALLVLASVGEASTISTLRHGDIAALTTRIEQLLGNAPVREQLGQQAHAFAQRFTWERAANDTEQFLLGVVRDRTRAVGKGS